MDITSQGHSSFRLKGKNAVLITDPYDSSIGLKFPKVEADIVTVSHDHVSHNYSQAVGGNPFVVQGPGEYEVRRIRIFGVASYHDNKRGKEKGTNTIYSMKIDGLGVAHLGDLGQEVLTDQQLEEMGQRTLEVVKKLTVSKDKLPAEMKVVIFEEI